MITVPSLLRMQSRKIWILWRVNGCVSKSLLLMRMRDYWNLMTMRSMAHLDCPLRLNVMVIEFLRWLGSL